MKKVIAMIAMALVAGAASADLLASYDFYGAHSTTSLSNAPGGTIVSSDIGSIGLFRSGGLSGAAAGSNWSHTAFTTGGTLATAVANGDYWQGYVAAAGNDVSITNIQLRLRSAANTSPTSYFVRVSTDSTFATYTDAGQVNLTATSGIYDRSFDVVGLISGSTVYYRIYAFGANVDTSARQGGFAGGNVAGTPSANAGLAGFGNADIVIQGSIPEPATVVMLGLGALITLIIRRMRS